jgi:hypothetical protein
VRKRPYEDGRRHWKDIATSQRCPELPDAERDEKDSLLDWSCGREYNLVT